MRRGDPFALLPSPPILPKSDLGTLFPEKKKKKNKKGVGYHPAIVDLCRLCLKQDLADRPRVDEVIERCVEALDRVAEDEGPAGAAAPAVVPKANRV